MKLLRLPTTLPSGVIEPDEIAIQKEAKAASEPPAE
jgi:hypothetical protein